MQSLIGTFVPEGDPAGDLYYCVNLCNSSDYRLAFFNNHTLGQVNFHRFAAVDSVPKAVTAKVKDLNLICKFILVKIHSYCNPYR